MLLATLILALLNPPGLTHDQAISAGYRDGSDAYWVARTGEPLDLTPRGR
jgi:hypothetical protein